MRSDSSEPGTPATKPETLRLLERELSVRATELRALARTLVGSQDADDVLQESATRALHRPPAHADGLRGFLRSVVRGVASNHLRAARRKQQRELLAARSEPCPSTASLVAEREALRNLTECLLALDEPFRSTLISRFFQERTPAQIAAARGVSVATVKSRLQRGLRKMRTALRARDRHWQQGLAILFGPLALGHSTATAPGALAGGRAVTPLRDAKAIASAFSIGALMTHAAKTVAALTVLLLATLAAFLGSDRTRPEPTPQLTHTVPERTALESSAPLAKEAVARREAESPLDSIGVDLAHPHEFSLLCRIVDRLGDPVAGRQIAVAPAAGAWNVWPERTNPDGEVDITWLGRSNHTRLAVGVVNGNAVHASREIELAARARNQLTLLSEQQMTCNAAASDMDCATCHAAVESVELVDPPGTPTALHPFARFQALAPLGGTGKDARTADPELADRELADRELADRELPVSFREPLPRLFGPVHTDPLGVLTRLRDRLAADRTSDGVGWIEGTVRDQHGNPVDGVVVRVGPYLTLPRSRVKTADGGKFRILDVPAGDRLVRCNAGLLGRASHVAGVQAEMRSYVDLQLTTRSALRGTVLGVDPESATSWHVELHSRDGAYAGRAQVTPSGEFLIADPSPTAGTLTLWRRGVDLPIAWIADVHPSAPRPIFDVSPETLEAAGTLTARVSVSTATSPRRTPRTEFRVRQLETGFCTTVGSDEDGRLELENLAAGSYQIEFGAPGMGWRTTPQVWVDGQGPTPLGDLVPPPAAELRIRLAAASLARVELFQRTAFGDRLAVQLEAASSHDLQLPAGEWIVLGLSTNGALLGEQITLRPGDVSTWTPRSE